MAERILSHPASSLLLLFRRVRLSADRTAGWRIAGHRRQPCRGSDIGEGRTPRLLVQKPRRTGAFEFHLLERSVPGGDRAAPTAEAVVQTQGDHVDILVDA